MLKKHIVLLIMLITVFIGVSVYGMETYTNDATGYMAYVIDNANLISSRTDLDQVMAAMDEITRFGNVIFLSNTSPHNNTTAEFALASYEKYFGKQSGVLFLIDMYEKEIFISCSGECSRRVSNYDSYAITDNIYTMATQEKYASCAIEAFDQLSQLLNGKRLASPMRLITNIFFAFLAAFLVNYIFVKSKSESTLPDFESLISANKKEKILNTEDVITKVTKTRHSSGSRSGGGRSGGGRSGGGHHSGGGHRF